MVGSYFDVPFGINVFDAAVSVESLQHFTKEENIHRQSLIALKAELEIVDDEFYHYDTPLTVKHETEALLQAGFSSVEVLNSWGATYTIKAVK